MSGEWHAMVCPKAPHDMVPFGGSGHIFHCPMHGVLAIVRRGGGDSGRPAPGRSPESGSGARRGPEPDGGAGRQNGRSPTTATRSATRRCPA